MQHWGKFEMTEKLKKHRQFWLVLPIVICIGIIVFGGINYLSNLRTNLTVEAIDNVLTVNPPAAAVFR